MKSPQIEISVPRFEFKATDKKLEFVRQQFPLDAQYALTTHKSQGRTLARSVYANFSDAPDYDFTLHGLCYVAFSRTRRREHVKIYGARQIHCAYEPAIDVTATSDEPSATENLPTGMMSLSLDSGSP